MLKFNGLLNCCTTKYKDVTPPIPASSPPPITYTYIDERIKPDSKYTLGKSVGSHSAKHMELSYVTWQAKRDGSPRLGVFKPAFAENTELYIASGRYGTEQVITEAFAARIFAALLGKQHAATSNLSLDNFGYISRVLDSKAQNLFVYLFCNDERKPFSAETFDSLLRTIAISILLADRDIKDGNLLVVNNGAEPSFVYGVDHEQCLNYGALNDDKARMQKFIKRIAADPTIFVYMLFMRYYCWMPFYYGLPLHHEDHVKIHAIIFANNTITSDKIFAILNEFIQKLQHDDFAIARQVQVKLLSKIPADYPADKKANLECELEALVANLKAIVTDVATFIAPYLPPAPKLSGIMCTV
jgi:hypothetical protein